jgi:ADP-ribose pyrophosphatase YjhB (NUDIX family)
MNQLRIGLREGALTLAYNAILRVRAAARQLTRPTTVGVRVLVERGDELLLIRHRGGSHPWSLPGGGVDHRESLAEAAMREVREEAGCAAELRYLLGVYHSFGEGMNNYTAVFVCAPLGEPRAPVGDLEIVDARFFRRNDLPATTDAGSLRRIAEHAAGQRGVHGPW